MFVSDNVPVAPASWATKMIYFKVRYSPDKTKRNLFESVPAPEPPTPTTPAEWRKKFGLVEQKLLFLSLLFLSSPLLFTALLCLPFSLTPLLFFSHLLPHFSLPPFADDVVEPTLSCLLFKIFKIATATFSKFDRCHNLPLVFSLPSLCAQGTNRTGLGGQHESPVFAMCAVSKGNDNIFDILICIVFTDILSLHFLNM